MSYEPISDGELAAVVTYLEMTSRPQLEAATSDLAIRPWRKPTCEDYRRLFRRVGAPWLWFSRLTMNDQELRTLIQDPAIEIYAVENLEGVETGILELDFRKTGECELAFLGLVPELSGKGHGKWLLAEALSRAWREQIRRVHVHTCSLDHPAALPAYRRVGFVPFRRAIERFPDPRLAGVLPSDCAPQIPLLGTVP
jgi:GNAT superfamily N-acetyltransferase